MTRLSEPWGTTRPYSDVRFSGGQHYHRPDLNLWPLFIHQAEILTLTGIAAVATGVLLGIRVWQRITDHSTRQEIEHGPDLVYRRTDERTS